VLKQLMIVATLLSTLTAAAQAPDSPVRLGPGITAPTIKQRTEPQYTEEASKEGVSGAVHLEALIHKDGTLEVIRVIKGLGFGLDESASSAVTQWRFTPATKDGHPVDILLNIDVTFNRVLVANGDIKTPTVIEAVQAQYTEEAAKAKVKGAVGLQFIVYYDGTVRVTKITKSLGYGLDESARTALEQTRFTPPTKNGHGIDVLMDAEVMFPQPQ